MPYPQAFWGQMSPYGNSLKVKSDENFAINLAIPIGYRKSECKESSRDRQPEVATEGTRAKSFIMSHVKMNGAVRRQDGKAMTLDSKKSDGKDERKALLTDKMLAPLENDGNHSGSMENLTLLDSIVRKMKCITDGIEYGWDSDNGCAIGSGDSVVSSAGQRHIDEGEGRIVDGGDALKESSHVEEKISEDSIQEYVPTEVEIPKVTSEVEESEIELPDVESIGLSATSDEFDGIDLPDQNDLRSASCESLESLSKFSLYGEEIDFETYTE